jgi:hypothetical protein
MEEETKGRMLKGSDVGNERKKIWEKITDEFLW